MLGDIGYGDMFHPNDDSTRVRYQAVTYALFILFLLLGLIITNMWVSRNSNSNSNSNYILKTQCEVDEMLIIW